MAMRDTSLSAYHQIKDGLSQTRGVVYEAIFSSDEPLCDFQIAERLGWRINCVTPRLGELELMTYILDDGLRVGPPEGREVHYWKINPAALLPGFTPKSLPRKAVDSRPRMAVPPNVTQAARIMAQHRQTCRRRKLRSESYPLFIGGSL